MAANIAEVTEEIEEVVEAKRGFLSGLVGKFKNWLGKVEEKAASLDDRADTFKANSRENAEKAKERLEQTKQNIKDQYRETRWKVIEAGERGIDAINNLPQNVLDTAKNIGNKIDNAAERYGDASDSLVEKAGKGINNTGKAIKKGGNQVLDGMAAGFDTTLNAIDNATSRAADGIENTGKAIKETAQNARSAIKQSFSWTMDKLREGKTLLQEKLADPYKSDMYKPLRGDLLSEINPKQNYTGKDVRNQLINEIARLGQDEPQVGQFGAIHANKMFNSLAKQMDKEAGIINGKYASHGLTLTGEQIKDMAADIYAGAEKDFATFVGHKQEAKGTGVSTFRLRNAAPGVAEAFGKEMKSHVAGAIIDNPEWKNISDNIKADLNKNVAKHSSRQAMLGTEIGQMQEAIDAVKGTAKVMPLNGPATGKVAAAR